MQANNQHYVTEILVIQYSIVALNKLKELELYFRSRATHLRSLGSTKATMHSYPINEEKKKHDGWNGTWPL